MNIIKCTIEGGKYAKYQSFIGMICGKTLPLGYKKYLTFSPANDAFHVSQLFVVVTFIRFTHFAFFVIFLCLDAQARFVYVFLMRLNKKMVDNLYAKINK